MPMRVFTCGPLSRSPQESSHGVFGGPFPRRRVVPGSVGAVQLRDFGHERVVGVGVGEKGAHREQHFRERQRRAPLVLQNVQANPSVGIDITVVNLRCKVHL